MTSVSCSIRQVTRLRRAAERARRILAEDPDLSPEERLSDGWSTSPYDPHTLRRVGETLWLQAGCALHAYVFRAGSNGISGAVPADAPLVTPDGRVTLRPTAVCWGPTWRVHGWLEPSLVGVDRRVLRQLNHT